MKAILSQVEKLITRSQKNWSFENDYQNTFYPL
jgi:hypothetical protein